MLIASHADSISRLPLEEEDNISDGVFKISLIDGLPLTATDIATEMVMDRVLSQVYQYVLGGWSQKG